MDFKKLDVAALRRLRAEMRREKCALLAAIFGKPDIPHGIAYGIAPKADEPIVGTLPLEPGLGSQHHSFSRAEKVKKEVGTHFP